MADPTSGNLSNPTDMKKYIILLLILSASCQKEEGKIDEDTRALDTTAVDTLPDGYVRIGDLIVNTNWDGEINMIF